MKTAIRATTKSFRRRNRASYHVHIHNQPHVPARDPHSSMPWHPAFLFLIPVLASVLQVHCQGSSPFQTHPENMWTFLLAMIINCFTLGYHVKSRLYNPTATTTTTAVFVQVALISGSLASAAIISIFTPHYFEPVIFIMWIFLSMYVIARKKIQDVAQRLYQSSKDAVSRVYNKWKGVITGNNYDGPSTI